MRIKTYEFPHISSVEFDVKYNSKFSDSILDSIICFDYVFVVL